MMMLGSISVKRHCLIGRFRLLLIQLMMSDHILVTLVDEMLHTNDKVSRLKNQS